MSRKIGICQAGICVLLISAFVSAAPGKPDIPRRASAHRGRAIFQRECVACHSVGHGDRIAPDLLGVTSRRSHAWLVTIIQRPALLLNQQDPVAVALLMKYKVRMPELKVTNAELDDLLAYFEAETARRDKN